MESYEHITSIIALALGASWASGLNLYATLSVLGLASSTGSMELPPDLQILENPLVIGASLLMYVIEFVADKIPGVDTAWDGIHTFVRIPAGAMLAAGAVGEAGPVMGLVAAILGGGMATATHVTKAGSRAVINTSPEPFSNWTASITEDVAVFGGLWAALNEPWLFLGLLFLFILFMIWLLPKIASAIAGIFKFIGRLFGAGQKEQSENPATEAPTATVSDTSLEKLEKLKQLHDSGALTEEEFTREKNKLLS
jgi:hypothetical protein